jgi:hypothetical protein
MKNKIFLGGTCAQSTWREEMIIDLLPPYFNPVVENWTPECQQVEWDEKNKRCNIHLYVITKEMTGVFSIAEVIDSVHTQGKLTVLHVVPDGFEGHQLKSLNAVVDLVVSRGGIAYVDDNLYRTTSILNKMAK